MMTILARNFGFPDWNRMGALYVLGTDYPGDHQFANLIVDPDLLLAFDHKVSIREQLRDCSGDVRLQCLPADHCSLSIAGAVESAVSTRPGSGL